MNTVILVGNTGQEPTIKYFESGASKVMVTLAVRRTKEITDWFDIEAWGKTGDILYNYVPKGTKIAVKGSLKIDCWDDVKTGNKREKPVILVESIEILSSKKEALNA